jgi:hypothetical protein
VNGVLFVLENHHHCPSRRNDMEMTGQVHGLSYLKQRRGSAFIPNPK